MKNYMMAWYVLQYTKPSVSIQQSITDSNHYSPGIVTPAWRNHLTASLNLVGMEEQRTLFSGHAGELYYNEKLEQFSLFLAYIHIPIFF